MKENSFQPRLPNPYTDRPDEGRISQVASPMNWIANRRFLIGAVVFLVIVFAALIAVNTFAIPGNNQNDAARMQVRYLEQAVRSYYMKTGKLPYRLEVLVTCPENMDKSQWKGPYLEGTELPADAWGNHFTLKIERDATTANVKIISSGADGLLGTYDDIESGFGVYMQSDPIKKSNEALIEF